VLAKAMEHAQHDEAGPQDGENGESGASHAASSEEVEAADVGATAASRVRREAGAREGMGTNRRAQMNAPSLRSDGTGRGVTPHAASELLRPLGGCEHQPSPDHSQAAKQSLV
jgi:hypothetical protein